MSIIIPRFLIFSSVLFTFLVLFFFKYIFPRLNAKKKKSTKEDILNVTDEIIDRYGKMPKEVENLLKISEIKNKGRTMPIFNNGIGLSLCAFIFINII